MKNKFRIELSILQNVHVENFIKKIFHINKSATKFI